MRRRDFVRGTALAAAGCAVAGAAWKGCRVDPRDLRVVRVRVPCPGLRAGEVRILAFSDVDWPRSEANWRRIPAIAAAFAPDLALLPGDLLDRASTATDPVVAADASAWLASALPGIPVLVAPGEAESFLRDRVAAAWSGRAAILANEARRFEIRGEPVEVFVVDPKVDPAPWGLARVDGRPLVRVRGRSHTSVLRARATPASPGELEATFPFRLVDPRATLEIRIAEGWRIRTRPGDRRFRLFRLFDASGPIVSAPSAPFAPPVGAWCRARVRFAAGARILARFWPDGAREPSEWHVDATDGAEGRPLAAGLAFGVRNGLVEVAEVRGAPIAEDFTDPSTFLERWEQNSRFAAWSRSRPSAPTRIVLAHHPDVALVLAEAGLPRPELVVAGHTHGGQIRLPRLGPVLTDTRLGRAFDRGIFEVEGTRLFVTAGVGTSILPVRWNVPPDVGLVSLVPGRRGDPATLVDSAAPEEHP